MRVPKMMAKESLAFRHYRHHFDHSYTEKPTAKSGRMAEFRAIAHLVRPYRRMVWLAWGSTAARAALLLLLPVFTKSAIDNGIIKDDPNALWTAAIASVVVIIVASGLAMLRWAYGYQLADHATVSLQTQIFAHMLLLSRPQLAAIGTGTLLSRVTNDAPAIRMLFQQGIVVVIRYGVAIIGSVTLMLMMDWQMTLVALCTLPLMVLITWLYKRAARPWFLQTRDTVAAVTGTAHESFSVMRLVHSYAREDQQVGAFNDANLANKNSQYRPMVYKSIFDPATALISSIALGGLIIYGGIQAVNGQAEIGTIVAFVGLLAAFLGGVVGVSGVVSVYESGIAAVDKCFDFLAITPEIDEPAEPVAMPVGTQEFVVDDVCFQFEDAPARSVDGISLTIPAGTRIALVGEVGAGRSTLARLIARLLAPTSGGITYGGVDLAQLDLRAFHDRVRFVASDPYVFSGTVAENLRMARPDATDEQLAGALRAVGGGTAVETFADGINSHVEPGGRNLSSGQIAMIGLSRALLNSPDVLIIDGILDRFDPVLVAALQQRVLAIGGDTTVILATKRRDIASHADLIAVLDAGRVVELGTHEELMGAGGPYSRLERGEDLAGTWWLPSEEGNVGR